MHRPLAAASTDRLQQQLADAQRAERQVRAAQLALLAELHARHVYSEDGLATMADWTTMFLAVSRDTGGRMTAVAARLAERPLTFEALSEGHISFDQAAHLSRIAGADNEAGVLADCAGLSVAQLAQLARKRRAREQALDKSSVRVWHDGDNAHHINGVLVGDDGATFAAALERESARIHAERRARCEPRTPLAERDAEALVNLARQHMVDDADADRADIVVHVDHDYLRTLSAGDDLEPFAGLRLPELAGGGVIHETTLERLLCDCRVQYAVDDNGTCIGITTHQRTSPPALTRQIKRRDRTCRFPGCTSRRFLRIHHIDFWEHGGTTTWRNLVAICPHHHKLVHEHGWTLTGDPQSTLTWTNPNGRTHTSDPPLLAP